MNVWRKIFIVFIATALTAWPVASMQAYIDTPESAYDTCIVSWSGLSSDFSAESKNIAPNAKPLEEVFCGHFMSVEDLPSDNGTADFAPTSPIFALQPFRLAEPITKRKAMPIISEHAPHSLNPEVAPHPPKYC